MTHVVPARTEGELRTHVSPADAGWTWLDFSLHVPPAGRPWHRESGDRELRLVFQAGDAEVPLGGERWSFELRRDVFASMAHAVYVPPGHGVEVTPQGEVEVEVGSAPAEGRLPPRLIPPEDVKFEIRGGHNVTRQISHILDPGDAEHLLCVEEYTPSGNGSSYPPHRHGGQ